MVSSFLPAVLSYMLLLAVSCDCRSINSEECCTTACIPSGSVIGSSKDFHMYDEEYLPLQYTKCLRVPHAKTHVTLELKRLQLGEGNQTTSDCKMAGEETATVNQLSILNGRADSDPLFYCSDVNLIGAETIKRVVSSPDYTMEFNLTAGQAPTDGDSCYEINYKLTYCPDIDGALISRVTRDEFIITCLEGSNGIDGLDVYRCKNGVWEQRGIATEPSCSHNSPDHPAETSGTGLPCEYLHELNNPITSTTMREQEQSTEEKQIVPNTIIYCVVGGSAIVLLVMIAILIWYFVIRKRRQPQNHSCRNESEMVQHKDPDISKPTLHRSDSIEMKQLNSDQVESGIALLEHANDDKGQSE